MHQTGSKLHGLAGLTRKPIFIIITGGIIPRKSGRMNKEIVEPIPLL